MGESSLKGSRTLKQVFTLKRSRAKLGSEEFLRTLSERNPWNLFVVCVWVPEGVCEIWLTSEDTGAYGRDIGTDLPTLLWELVKEIPEGCMLRLGMTNPPYILEHLEVSEVPQRSRL